MGEEDGILGGRPGLSKGVEDWAEEGGLLSEEGGRLRDHVIMLLVCLLSRRKQTWLMEVWPQ